MSLSVHYRTTACLVLTSHVNPDCDDLSHESRQIWHYFIGEKSVERMYVTSIFSTSWLARSDFAIS
jgi:hypothetical protein